ncbi:MAG: hypothetical protein AAGA56_20055 [Myxococcota bacterium]
MVNSVAQPNSSCVIVPPLPCEELEAQVCSDIGPAASRVRGMDTCRQGSCSVHFSAPCPLSMCLRCDEDTASCDARGDWAPCRTKQTDLCCQSGGCTMDGACGFQTPQ